MQKYCYILISVIVLAFSCNNKSTNFENAVDCFSDRKDIKTHPMREGEIKEVMAGFFAITVGEGERYDPCNLEAKWKIVGKKVKFKGIEKEIFPHERRAATPFLLHDIQVSK
ncbi:MAG: hypothetical protein AB8H03_08375 [Saprospiraceae bacterium]